MDLTHLTTLCKRYAIDASSKNRTLPDLTVFQRHEKSDIEAFVYKPAICLILQGSKVTYIGDQLVELQAGDALLISHDLPVVSRITKADVQAPYIAAILTLDLGLVRGLYDQVGDALLPVADVRSLSAGPADPAWLAPLVRYFELLDNPLDAKVLGPGIKREIHYRLLLSPIGKMLRNLIVADSHASRVAKAIGRVRAEFRTTLPAHSRHQVNLRWTQVTTDWL